MMNFERYPENEKYFSTDMLFHYTRLDTALERIISNRNLRFSSFKNVNDPSESTVRDITLNWNTTEFDKDMINTSEYFNIVNNIRLVRSRLICFSMNADTVVNNKDDDLENYFQTGFFKPRMWAQYGENNRGICLAFSKQDFAESIEKQYPNSLVYRSKIKYSDSGKNIRKAYRFEVSENILIDFNQYFIKEHLAKYREELFFSKNSDWRDEREYRFLMIGDEDYKEYFVDINHSLKGIFCGINFPDVYLHSLKKLTSGMNIDIFQLKLNNGEPHVNKV
ncbi:MAG: DUF2971 domain-containing protein [Peptostreptococcaceae bacterium]|nr:DUF2971 domain-containing protein [Peptostreptococcaceae bacterium]